MRASVVAVAVAAGIACATGAAAQDPVTSNPSVYHVVLENSTVRVLHVTVKVGGKTTLHEHPDNAVVVLTDSKMRFTGADGQSQDMTLKANQVVWMAAGKHAGENIGTGPIEALVIELKGNAAPTATLPAGRPDTALAVAFDNPRARGAIVTLQPAFHEPAGTTHDYAQVVVSLDKAPVSITIGGKTRTDWKRGDALFIGRGEAHESKVTGQKPTEVFILAVK